MGYTAPASAPGFGLDKSDGGRRRLRRRSPLTWRTAIRNRNSEDDDSTIIRHLHDLAALERGARTIQDCARWRAPSSTWAQRAPKQKNVTGIDFLKIMPPKITSDPTWRQEYEQFIDAVSYGTEWKLAKYLPLPFRSRCAVLPRHFVDVDFNAPDSNQARC